MPHISIKAEELGQILAFPVTNSFLLTYLLLVIFLIFALIYNYKLGEKDSRFVLFVRFSLNGLYSLFQSILGDEAKKFFSLVASFFLFILFSNWLGLLPGVGSIIYRINQHDIPLFRGGTADLNTTLGLAFLSVILIQYYGVKYLGFKTYIKKFINFANPITFFTGLLETISEFSRIISFAFRLFGNIFAGEVLLTIIAFLIPILAPFPFLILEVFVGLVQALVFAMLTAVFIKMAIAKLH